MWGSLIIGVMPNMKNSIEWADKLMLEFKGLVKAHTIDQFSLSETLLMNYKIVEGKRFVSHYSTDGPKESACETISK